MDNKQLIEAAAHKIKNQVAVIVQAIACLEDNNSAADENIKLALSYIQAATAKIDTIINNLAEAKTEGPQEGGNVGKKENSHY